MKLIVTGSRNWEQEQMVVGALDLFLGTVLIRGDPLTVIHGACPTGADEYAHQWYLRMVDWPVHEKRWPANWGKYGSAAGPIRNESMVDWNLDADFVLAFPLGESRGTRGCMKYAEYMGLQVINLGDK